MGSLIRNGETVEVFDIKKYTVAPLQIEATIQFRGKSPEKVFEILGNPTLIPQWFLLAKGVKIHSPSAKGGATFNVEFIFFGDVYEEVLVWEIPKRYVYLAKGEGFPIKDYIACIEIEKVNKNEGFLHWRIYYSRIEGEHFQKIIPVILPPIIKESFKKLCPLVGGTEIKISSNEE